MKLLSYNLLKHRAIAEVEGLTKKYGPDALCLQEANVESLPQSIGNLELAIGTDNNRLGLAIYIDRSKYAVEAVKSFSLKHSTYDRIASPAHERLLGARIRNSETGQKLAIGSFHASPLTALNSIRRDQIRTGLLKLDELGERAPLVMIGDFNYPLFRKRLDREVASAGFQLHTSDDPTYHHFKVIRGYFDFAAAKNVNFEWMKTLKQGLSDHLPVLLQANTLSGI